MKTKFTSVILCSLLAIGATFAESKTIPSATSPDLVTIFEAPLVCQAAPAIGCGSRAKPMLLDLEKTAGVSEAWLNRAGTRIAVIWKKEVKSGTRSDVAKKLEKEGAKEIQGEDRKQAVAEILSGRGWYRGADVDRLSEEEAGIIAARWVARVRAKTSLPPEKAEGLRRVITDALKKCFTEEGEQEKYFAMLESEEGLQKFAGDYLSKEQIPFLKVAVEQGLRPLPNEK